MARHRRSTRLETKAARLRLAVRRKPYFEAIAPRVGIGYRRNQGSGTWVARGSDGHGGYWTKAIAVADDFEDANATSVLTFWQAQDKARSLVRGSQDHSIRPATVAEALEHYAADLKARSGSTANARRVLALLPPSLSRKTVAALGTRELRHWRDGLLARMKASSADRTARMLKAALNLAARDDPRITNASAWKTALSRLPEAEPPPNKIISDDAVRAIVSGAYAVDQRFGLFVEALAATGARSSQLLRLEVADLQDGTAPRLMMPSSRKGRRRRVTRQPLPIPPGLAAALRRHAEGRELHEFLFSGSDGERSRHLFRRLAASLGFDNGVSLYSLRHSSIVRQLVSGVPTRIVAAHHDTSVPVLEHTYSRHIATVSDAVVRQALVDFGGGRP
jgi:integrase